ncbi:2TM domain-containing protein [Microbacterium sp. NPDC078428]|uniref:2TM domain-containing protein n=1 Tax=Microbacterium sp. NPDC078428 TaxID=3364190 RepID=UPI0037C6E069
MSDDELRRRAISRLKAKSRFWQALVAWVVLSLLFVLIWAFSGGMDGGIEGFWPVWPIVGIAIGVVFAGVAAFGSGGGAPTESRIQSEMKRLSD